MPEATAEERLARIEALVVALVDAQAGVARNVDIAALGKLVEQQRDDIAGLKDDMSVLTAIVQRLDNSHTRLLTEIRATHAQISRLGNRVSALEEREQQ